MEAQELRKKVEEVMETIRPRLQMDGGDVCLVDIEGDVVKVELEGACKGCPMSQLTLQMGIERTIIQEIPEIKRVEAVNSSVSPDMMAHIKEMYDK